VAKKFSGGGEVFEEAIYISSFKSFLVLVKGILVRGRKFPGRIAIPFGLFSRGKKSLGTIPKKTQWSGCFILEETLDNPGTRN